MPCALLAVAPMAGPIRGGGSGGCARVHLFSRTGQLHMAGLHVAVGGQDPVERQVLHCVRLALGNTGAAGGQHAKHHLQEDGLYRKLHPGNQAPQLLYSVEATDSGAYTFGVKLDIGAELRPPSLVSCQE